MNLKLTEDLLLGQLADMTAVGATLTGAKLHLTKVDMPPDPTTPLADFTANQADFGGYAAKTVTWSAPSRSDDGSIELIGTTTEFRYSGTPGNSCFNAYLTDAGATKLLGVARFDDPPVPFGATTDAATLVIRYRPASGSLIVVVS